MRKKICISNNTFGEMEFLYGWRSKTIVSLWGKSYEITLFADSKSADIGVTENQERAYMLYKENQIEIQQKIEKLIEEHYGSNDPESVSAKFTPSRLFFCVNGNCALLGSDADDPDAGFAVCIFPNMEIYSEEQYVVENIAY